MSPVQDTHIHQECIAMCARNVSTIPNIVVTADNLVVMGVGGLDMALATSENRDTVKEKIGR
jgi:hypothetical protein